MSTASNPRECWMAWVSGRVQGVGFRYSAQRQAINLQLTGWVRNLSDGRVEICFAGSTHAVSAMKQWLHHGPTYAEVASVEFEPALCPQLTPQFEIR